MALESFICSPNLLELFLALASHCQSHNKQRCCFVNKQWMCLTSDIHCVIADPGESAEEKLNSKSLRLSFTRKQDVGWH